MSSAAVQSPLSILADLWPGGDRYPTPYHLALVVNAQTKQSPALTLLDAALVKLARGESKKRLIVSFPPQEGKSERGVRTYALWLLQHDPTLKIAIVSFEDDTAKRWGRQIKRDIAANPQLGLHIRADSSAAGRWETEEGGGIYCIGFRGSLTGRPVDVLLIDDPHKDRAAAESRRQRDAVWDFWESTGKFRLSARGIVLLILTRWHTDDLAGQLLKAEPDEWDVLSIPAIAETEDDVIGRATGEEFPSIRGRAPGYFRKIRGSVSKYVWLSMMQQRPVAAEGNLLSRLDFRYWRRDEDLGPNRVDLDGRTLDLRDGLRFMTVDLAASERTSADWTVASAWLLTVNKDLLLLDRVRGRTEEGGHWDLVTPLRTKWLGPYDVVHVEKSFFNTTFSLAAGQNGVPLQPLTPDTDKLTRTLPLSMLLKQHKVWWPADAPWLDEWCDELADFPNARHDDQVDTASYAAQVAFTHHAPTGPVPQRHRDREIDLMTTPW